jgi:selenocysteine lyase/cysteine desulfurase
MYSPRLMRRLQQMPDGMVRVSLVHYNTVDEIARFHTALAAIVTQRRTARPAAENGAPA